MVNPGVEIEQNKCDLMPDFNISLIDWMIILLYFVFIIWRGIGYAKKHENAEDYFLAGRSLTWPLIGLSLYASNISSSSLIGMAASGYETGYSVFSYEWMSAVVLIIFAIFSIVFFELILVFDNISASNLFGVITVARGIIYF